jgi:hypothetical protein
MKRIALTLVLLLLTMAMYSQSGSANSQNSKIPTDNRFITLQKLVDKIKSETESLRNIETVNVMVNDMLIENPQEYMINPQNIKDKEVLVLNSTGTNKDTMIASIIINTRNR